MENETLQPCHVTYRFTCYKCKKETILPPEEITGASVEEIEKQIADIKLRVGNRNFVPKKKGVLYPRVMRCSFCGKSQPLYMTKVKTEKLIKALCIVFILLWFATVIIVQKLDVSSDIIRYTRVGGLVVYSGLGVLIYYIHAVIRQKHETSFLSCSFDDAHLSPEKLVEMVSETVSDTKRVQYMEVLLKKDAAYAENYVREQTAYWQENPLAPDKLGCPQCGNVDVRTEHIDEEAVEEKGERRILVEGFDGNVCDRCGWRSDDFDTLKIIPDPRTARKELFDAFFGAYESTKNTLKD